MNRKKLIGVLFGLGVVGASLLFESSAEVIGNAFAIAGFAALLVAVSFDARSPLKILPREGYMDWEIYLGLCLGGVVATAVTYHRDFLSEYMPFVLAIMLTFLVALGLDFLQSKNEIIEIVAIFVALAIAIVGWIFFGWSLFVIVPITVGVILHVVT